MAVWVWLGITLSLVQAGIFSGLNLAVFSVSKLRLQVEASGGNRDAQRVLALRGDSNLLLATILWGNVAVNVLLAQLASSVLAGLLAFLFSTVVLTLAGEIFPQAYFSRNALRIASRLSPMLRLYRILLFPVAKPTALLLDLLLGSEQVNYLTEPSLRELITLHTREEDGEVSPLEAQGAINFLALDDLPVAREGEPLDPHSILQLQFTNGRPLFPDFERTRKDAFIQDIHRSGKKWIVLASSDGTPQLVLNADGFLREALLGCDSFTPLAYCHRPLVVTHAEVKLGELLPRLSVQSEHSEDDVIDNDIILLWGNQKRVITGADILGRLLRGIAKNPGGPVPRRTRSI